MMHLDQITVLAKRRAPFGTSEHAFKRMRPQATPPPPPPQAKEPNWWQKRPTSSTAPVGQPMSPHEQSQQLRLASADTCYYCPRPQPQAICDRCDRELCALCTRACSVCAVTSCPFCIVVDYDAPVETELCLACCREREEGEGGRRGACVDSEGSVDSDGDEAMVYF